eukprot:SAG22_NODE_4509_length_1248_cov_1.200174_1_plen_370_part_01
MRARATSRILLIASVPYVHGPGREHPAPDVLAVRVRAGGHGGGIAQRQTKLATRWAPRACADGGWAFALPGAARVCDGAPAENCTGPARCPCRLARVCRSGPTAHVGPNSCTGFSIGMRWAPVRPWRDVYTSIPAGDYRCECPRDYGGESCSNGDDDAEPAQPVDASTGPSCPHNSQRVLVVQMDAVGGDGWNGNQLMITERGTANTLIGPLTVPAGESSSTDSECYIPSTCYDVKVDFGIRFEEVSWSLSFENGTAILEGGAPFSGQLGSCECRESPVTVEMTDSSNYNGQQGDGWNDNKLVITVDGSSSRHELRLNNDDRETIDGDERNIRREEVCLPVAACYMVEVGGGSFQDEVGWSLTADDGTAL